MSNRTAAASLVFYLALGRAVLGAQADPVPSFPSEVELVTVDVVVADKKTGAVGGLKREDFTVVEDGKPQTIASFEAVEVPAAATTGIPLRPRVSTNTDAETRTSRSFVILFDDIHLSPLQATRAKNAVAEFLKTGVREGDRVSLIATGGGVWWSTRMEAGREDLLSLLKRLEGRQIRTTQMDRMSDWEAMRIHAFHDNQVAERVQRRYESLGINMGSSSASPTSDPNSDRRIGDNDPFVESRAIEVYTQATTKARLALDVMERAVQSLATTKGRKSVILVSEGFIYDPNLDEFKDIIQACRRANAAIYFVDTRGLEGLPSSLMSAEFGTATPQEDIGAALSDSFHEGEGAESLSADSGGFIVKNTNDLGEGIQRIADDSKIYYLLGYASTNPARDGKFRKIQVKVNRKGVQVRARKGYFAPLAGAAPKKQKPTEATSDPAIQAALDAPYDVEGIPLRLTAYVLDETLLSKAKTVLAAEVDVAGFAFNEVDGRFVDSMEMLLVAAHRETGEYYRYDQTIDMKLLPATRERLKASWYGIARDFELPAGGYQARLVIRDKNSGRVGSVTHDFDVPDLATWHTSSIILSDTLQPTEDPTIQAPKLIARRTFTAAPGAFLYAQFESYGSGKDAATGMPKVRASHKIVDREGTLYARSDPSMIVPTSIGRVSRLMGFRIDTFPPGTYELVLSLVDDVTGDSKEIREPFVIVAAEPAKTGEASPTSN